MGVVVVGGKDVGIVVVVVVVVGGVVVGWLVVVVVVIEVTVDRGSLVVWPGGASRGL